MDDTKAKSLKLLETLIGKHLYSSARNLADWCCAQWPEAFEFSGNAGAYRVWMQADAAKNLCDYRYALEKIDLLMKKVPEYYPDVMQKLTRICEEGIRERKPPKIVCDHPRLVRILDRLIYVYDAIDKPVHIFVAENEEKYNAFYSAAFPGEEIYPFGTFMACGFHGDPEKTWIVFKPEYLADDITDEELLGLCAHEMAHLDICSKGIGEKFVYTKHLKETERHISERLIDLYVMAKGFAWPLYRSRLRFGSAPSVMSLQEIQAYISLLKDQ